MFKYVLRLLFLDFKIYYKSGVIGQTMSTQIYIGNYIDLRTPPIAIAIFQRLKKTFKFQK